MIYIHIRSNHDIVGRPSGAGAWTESRFQYSGVDVQSSGVRQGSGIVMMAHGVEGSAG